MELLWHPAASRPSRVGLRSGRRGMLIDCNAENAAIANGRHLPVCGDFDVDRSTLTMAFMLAIAVNPASALAWQGHQPVTRGNFANPAAVSLH
jgi:hypothetical protein